MCHLLYLTRGFFPSLDSNVPSNPALSLYLPLLPTYPSSRSLWAAGTWSGSHALSPSQQLLHIQRPRQLISKSDLDTWPPPTSPAFIIRCSLPHVAAGRFQAKFRNRTQTSAQEYKKHNRKRKKIQMLLQVFGICCLQVCVRHLPLSYCHAAVCPARDAGSGRPS